MIAKYWNTVRNLKWHKYKKETSGERDNQTTTFLLKYKSYDVLTKWYQCYISSIFLYNSEMKRCKIPKNFPGNTNFKRLLLNLRNIKGCVCYIFASLFKSKWQHLLNWEKCSKALFDLKKIKRKNVKFSNSMTSQMRKQKQIHFIE